MKYSAIFQSFFRDKKTRVFQEEIGGPVTRMAEASFIRRRGYYPGLALRTVSICHMYLLLAELQLNK